MEAQLRLVCRLTIMKMERVSHAQQIKFATPSLVTKQLVKLATTSRTMELEIQEHVSLVMLENIVRMVSIDRTLTILTCPRQSPLKLFSASQVIAAPQLRRMPVVQVNGPVPRTMQDSHGPTEAIISVLRKTGCMKTTFQAWIAQVNLTEKLLG